MLVVLRLKILPWFSPGDFFALAVVKHYHPPGKNSKKNGEQRIAIPQIPGCFSKL
jgi:hypothetical protein